MSEQDALLLIGVGGAPIVVGIVELAKRMLKFEGDTETRAAIVLALCASVLLNMAVLDFTRASDMRWSTMTLLSIQTWLSAMGVFSGGKAIHQTYRGAVARG